MKKMHYDREMIFSDGEKIDRMFKMASVIADSTTITPYTYELEDLGSTDITELVLRSVDSTHVCLFIQATYWTPKTMDNEDNRFTSWENIQINPDAISKSINGKGMVCLKLLQNNSHLLVSHRRCETAIGLESEVQVPKDLEMDCTTTLSLDRLVLIEGIERILQFGSNRFQFVIRDESVYLETVGQGVIGASRRTFMLDDYTVSGDRPDNPDSPEYKADYLKKLLTILKSSDAQTVKVMWKDNCPLFVDKLPSGEGQTDYWRFILAPMVKE